MTDAQFRELLENCEAFQVLEKFKKAIHTRAEAVKRLKDYYQQAERYGIEYLKQNFNLMSTDVKLIESALEYKAKKLIQC